MIDISEHVPDVEKEILMQLTSVSEKLGREYLLIGAAARDFMGYRHGLAQKRATQDTDIAIQVSSWDEFGTFRSALVQAGFSPRQKQAHRLISSKGKMLDIVPFGPIADANQNIYWPPDQSTRMSVLGFEDAIKLAETYVINHDPEIKVRVASTEGLICLKFISWLERPADLKQKDASDIGYLLESCEKFFGAEVYDDLEILENYGYEIGRVAAYLLGRRIKQSVSREVLTKIAELKTTDSSHHDLEEFILDAQFRGRVDDEDETCRDLLEAFFSGVLE